MVGLERKTKQDREVQRRGGGKKGREARDREGVNIKACFKGHRHFVPDDNHFPLSSQSVRLDIKQGNPLIPQSKKKGGHILIFTKM